MLETTSESVYQRGIFGTGKTLGKIPEFRGCGKNNVATGQGEAECS